MEKLSQQYWDIGKTGVWCCWNTGQELEGGNYHYLSTVKWVFTKLDSVISENLSTTGI